MDVWPCRTCKQWCDDDDVKCLQCGSYDIRTSRNLSHRRHRDPVTGHVHDQHRATCWFTIKSTAEELTEIGPWRGTAKAAREAAISQMVAAIELQMDG